MNEWTNFLKSEVFFKMFLTLCIAILFSSQVFAENQYMVTLNVNDAAMGSVEGAGLHDSGDTVTVSAIANPHYVFIGWSNGVSMPTFDIVLDGDTNLTAYFAIEQFTVTAVSNDNTMGEVSGSGDYDYSGEATLTAIPAEHHHFVNWNNGITNNPYAVEVTSDTVVVANFAIDRHNVVVSSNDERLGTVMGSGTYDYGTKVVITAVPAHPHYSFQGWSNGMTAPTDTIDLAKDTVITAIFAIDSHTVTINVNYETMGSVEGSGSYEHGDTVTIRAIANPHYVFMGWSNGVSMPTFDIVLDGDTNLTAYFAIEQFTVTAVSNDNTMGEVSGSGDYDYSGEATLTAIPAEHHHFVNWNNGITDNPWVIAVTLDTVVVANFAIDRHNVVVSSNDEKLGTVMGSGTYDYGTKVVITAVPAHPHYSFQGWSNGMTAPTDTIDVTKDTVITAIFAIDRHTVTLNVNYEAMGSVEGSGVYEHGDTVMVRAIANSHYVFTGWSNGMSRNSFDIVLDRDTELTAFFASGQLRVTAIPNDKNMGSVSGSGNFDYNDSILLTATPAEHYHFEGWNNGVTTEQQILAVTTDTTIVANFAINRHYVTVLSNDDKIGTVTGMGSYDYGTQVTITAIPSDYYSSFVRWSNGLTTSTAVINLAEDTIITAIFALNEYSIALNVSDDDMGSVLGAGVYTYGDIATLTATSADCYSFIGWNDGITDNPRMHTVLDNLSLTAIFAIDNHAISVSSNDNIAGKAFCKVADSTMTSMNVTCGSYVEICAEPAEFYRFVEWSDGVTDAIRNIEVITDSAIVAIFEPKCSDFADFPVQFLFNGLLLVDLDSIQSRGYNPMPDQVGWYQVVGDVDSLNAQFPIDDKLICNGYYLSLPANDICYGKYYAVVDVSNTPDAICHDKMRTVIVEYADKDEKVNVAIAPTNVKTGDIITITGLNTEEITDITICDYAGRMISFMQSEGLTNYDFHVNCAAGVYMVKVTSGSVNMILRFIVSK